MQQAIDTIQHPAAAAIVPQDKRRVAAAIEALAPNSRKQYGSAWKRFAAWCEANNRQALPATAESLADYLQVRHAQGVSPATLRIDRAAASKVHAVAGLDSPGADSLVKDTMHSLAREGRGRGRGQAQGLQRQDAIAVAANGEKSLSGLRDGAIIAIMSDGLLRISETSAIDVGHVQTEADGSGRLHLPQRKTDQLGEGTTLYLTRRTVRRLRAWTDAAGIESGPLFCQIRKGNRVQGGARLSAEAIRAIIRKRTRQAASDIDADAGRVSGHSLRVGSAQSLAAAGIGIPALQAAGGWRSEKMPGLYAAGEEAAKGAVAQVFEE